MPQCSVDGRETELRLCNGCLDQLKAELRAIPDLVQQLDITLTRQARIGERNGPRGTETPMPFHAGASVDLETIRDTLLMWCRAIAAQRGIVFGLTLNDPVELSKWLLRYPTEIAQFEDVAELVENIHSMTKTARRTIDLAPDKRFLGPCDSCGEDLYVFATPGRLPETVHCANTECDFSAPVKERRLWLLEKAGNQLLTAAEMSRAIRELLPGQTITPHRISVWADRGKITKFLPHPKDPHNRPRFLVDQVIRLAHEAMGVNQQKETA